MHCKCAHYRWLWSSRPRELINFPDTENRSLHQSRQQKCLFLFAGVVACIVFQRVCGCMLKYRKIHSENWTRKWKYGIEFVQTLDTTFSDEYSTGHGYLSLLWQNSGEWRRLRMSMRIQCETKMFSLVPLSDRISERNAIFSPFQSDDIGFVFVFKRNWRQRRM